MQSLVFVIRMLALAGAFMLARFLMPHVIDQVAFYVAVVLSVLAMCGAVVGLIRG